MKKCLCMLLTGAFLLSLTACGPPLFLSEEQSGYTISTTIPTEKCPDFPMTTPAETQSVFTKSYGSYTYTITGEQQTGKMLAIRDKTSGKVIQTIQFGENEWFAKDPIYLVDVTFDGNADILVPFSRPASGVFFQAYVWESKTEQYQHIPSFETIPNIALDAESKELLSRRTASRITSYGMYIYSIEEKAFIPIRSLYWEPQENQQSLLVTEISYTADGAEDQVKHFSVSSSTTGIDKNDARMVPYFSKSSVWNLNSNKWDNFVIPDSDLLY